MNKNGYVFLCNEETEGECLERNLFGGTMKYEPRVRGLEIGDIVFTFNQQRQQLVGIFEAVSGLQANIIPGAWNGEYPLQVQVRRLEVHAPISRSDIGPLLKYDRNHRPTSRLTPDTVDALVKLFRAQDRKPFYDDSNSYRCKDGHWVKSRAEQQIDDWLYENRIVHVYEKGIPGGKLCDFFVPNGSDDNDGTYIEFWGLTHDSYVRNREHKELIYTKHGLKLVSIESGDTKNFDKILKRQLLENGIVPR